MGGEEEKEEIRQNWKETEMIGIPSKSIYNAILGLRIPNNDHVNGTETAHAIIIVQQATCQRPPT